MYILSFTLPQVY